jgi:hypothetical protein
MNIQRAVALNPVEPSVLSFRAPMGIETKLNVTFLDQSGAPHTQDLAAQLQLTGRTDNRTLFYSMPSSDVVNGKARAIIPSDVLTDPNGYRLRITGTLNGEAALLAMGVALPIPAAGPEAVPSDIIDLIDLSFERNEDVELDVKLWTDAGGDAPYDLTQLGTTISANIYDAAGGGVLMPFTVTVIASNAVRLSLTVDQVNALPDACWWSLAAAQAGGLTTLCEGNVTVKGTVIPPLVESIYNYDYQKPDTGDPASGQFIHGNWTQDALKIAKLDYDGLDRTATLQLIIPGDQIVAGLTTWTVQRSFDMVGWYEFTVLPVQQAAVVGVTPVTFTRPVT